MFIFYEAAMCWASFLSSVTQRRRQNCLFRCSLKAPWGNILREVQLLTVYQGILLKRPFL